jgi:hypothetical protein
MRIDHKREILQVNDDELTSLFNGLEKVVFIDKQMGFVKRLDLTYDEREVFRGMYERLCPFFGVEPQHFEKDVNIQSNPIQTSDR